MDSKYQHIGISIHYCVQPSALVHSLNGQKLPFHQVAH